MNTLIILENPDRRTQSHVTYNGDFYENVTWEIKGNTLHFVGDEILTRSTWMDGKIIDEKFLKSIEDHCIKERPKGIWKWRRMQRYVSGYYILKKRIHKTITTNV